MELTKKDIITRVVKAAKNTRTTLDENKNVPDHKMDIEKIIQVKANVVVRESQLGVDKVHIEGVLKYNVLYSAANETGTLDSLEGEVPIQETITINGALPEDMVKVKANLEDYNVTMINSRKIGMKALVAFEVTVSEEEMVPGCVELSGREAIQVKKNDFTMTQLVVDKKDNILVKETMNLPANKPNMNEIIWGNFELRNVEAKLVDYTIQIKGELSVCVLYQGEEDQMITQSLEVELPFSSQLECQECKEGMIPNILATLVSAQANIGEDSDGEPRALELEGNIDLDIKLYDEEEIHLIEDAYLPGVELKIEKRPFPYEKLIMRNHAKTKVSEKMKVKDNQPRLLQITNVTGEIKVDETIKEENGLRVEGVIYSDVLYISSDDRMPFYSIKALLPFSQLIEIEGFTSEDRYEIVPCIDQMNGIMLDSEEMEIKATISFEVMGFTKGEGVAMVSVEEEPMDIEKLSQVEPMIGYIVKEKDTLWDIAKRYFTTMEQIRAVNELESDEITPRQKLLIVKETKQI